MKGRSLVFFILLSTFIIILLSTAAQATEYKEINTEVKADDILKHIENGEDVNLTNCHIIGKLNVSEIKLKTVPNPYFNIIKEDEFLPLGINEKSSVIESNIAIKDSIIENGIDFSNVIFNDSVDFSETTFNNFTHFSITNYNNPADFSHTNFNSFTDFSGTTFNDSIDFSGVNFNGSTFFSGTYFNNSTNFAYANFNDSIDFIGTNFYNSVQFFNANFHNFAGFSYVNFYNSASFSEANFYNSADFDYTNFYYFANFDETNFYNSIGFKGPNTPENIIVDGKNSELFMNYYKNEARYADADIIYYNYRLYSQERKSLVSLSKWADIISWITCGYGLRPLRTLYFGGVVILLFSLIYWKGSGIYRSSYEAEKKHTVSGLDALLFSVREFTTLGSADWYPRDNIFRILVTLEGLLGWVMLGIFMATLTNVMIRS